VRRLRSLRVAFAVLTLIGRMPGPQAVKRMLGFLLARAAVAAFLYVAPRRRLTWSGIHRDPMHNHLLTAMGVGLAATIVAFVVGTFVARRVLR
jgi:hypothetical protein